VFLYQVLAASIALLAIPNPVLDTTSSSNINLTIDKSVSKEKCQVIYVVASVWCSFFSISSLVTGLTLQKSLQGKIKCTADPIVSYFVFLAKVAKSLKQLLI
jgi:hypothetical protein